MIRRLLIVFLFLIPIALNAQNNSVKYVYYDSVITDLKVNSVNSKYYSIVNPYDLLYLNNECFDFITTLYNLNKKGDLNKNNFNPGGNNIGDKRIDFSAESFAEIFNDEKKTKLFVEKLAGSDYDNNVHLYFPICIYNKYAIITVNGSFWSDTYYASLQKDVIYFSLLRSIIE